ncbi:class I SAM-dependent methyltransferase [Streptomyces gamaensis]|uniref:Class I SAM-dependent methyltransferase n=1 Tax=Streptomyces gamaensis TaxID=1763542 RepID=A0ABW0Z395_9ACTN
MSADETPTICPEIIDYYTNGYEEADRFAPGTASGASMLEFTRIQELLRAHLPQPPASVLDVGGGPGAHARWLTADGHTVHLIDPVPKHVDQGRAVGIDAVLGDARRLNCPSHTYDAVLLLGPLYHLTQRAERVLALKEAVRVARPGALIAVAAMNRYSRFLDQAAKHALTDPAVCGDVVGTTDSGICTSSGGFTTSYFHTVDELRTELTDAGLFDAVIRGAEGPGYWIIKGIEQHNCTRISTSSQEFSSALAAARLADARPALLAASAHLLAIAHAPQA